MNSSGDRMENPRTADNKAIGMLMRRIAESWDAGDPVAFASNYAPDADYIAFDGTHVRGREAIAEVHRELFEFFNGVVRGSRLLSERSGIRFLTPDVALVHATGAVLFPWQKEIARERRSINTSVVVRQPDGRWLVAAFQNTRVKPRPVPTGFPRRLLAALFGLRARMAGKR